MITQAQIDQLKWFHDYDFPGGLHAKSAETGIAFQKLRLSFIMDQLSQIDFADKSVIDIGCWDGYLSFYAERRGAKSVLAVDDFSQNWGSAECFRIAKELFRSNVEFMPDVSVYEVSKRINKTFDIIIFAGVYYHLHSPFNAFAEIRALCHENSVVAIEGECIRIDEESFADSKMSDPHFSQFTPTTRYLQDLLYACYLETDSIAYMSELNFAEKQKTLSPSDLLGVAKMSLKSKRSTAQVSPMGEPTERIFLVAKPFQGKNPYHLYKAPFGLWRYDTRGNF